MLKSDYRNRGVLEFLVNVQTGQLYAINIHAQISSFKRRNQNLLNCGESVEYLLAHKAMKIIRLPHNGRLINNNTFSFLTTDLKYNSKTKTFTAPNLTNISCLSECKIQITNPKTEISISLEHNSIKFPENIKKSLIDNAGHKHTHWYNPEYDVVFKTVFQD